MTVEKIESAELLTAEAAGTLTQNIRDAAQKFADAALDLTRSKALLFDAVEEAQTAEAWRPLGFKSWTAYIADTFGAIELPAMSKEERDALVGFLWAQGMSTRAIAPITGQSQATVSRLTRALAEKDIRSDEKRMVMGLDGKTRRTPTPKVKPEVVDGEVVEQTVTLLSSMTEAELAERKAEIARMAAGVAAGDVDFLLSLQSLLSSVIEAEQRKAKVVPVLAVV